MTKDIYTRREIVTPSEEHVVPRCLGGRLSRVGLIDKETNDRFGSGIDARLDEALRSARIFLGAKSSDGKEPRALSSVIGEDGKVYRIESGGVIIATPEVVTTRLESGETRIEGTVPNEDAVRRMLRKYARRSGKSLSELMGAFMATSRDQLVAPPAMTFELNVWGDEPYRAIAKIAGNLLACNSPDRLLDDEFNAVRMFVLNGVIPNEEPVVAADFDLGENGPGRLDHFIKIESDHSGHAVALVVFFRFLAFVVKLGKLPLPKGFRTSYRVDQLAGVHWVDESTDLEIPMPSFAESARHCGAALVAIAEKQVGQLVPALQKAQRDLWLESLIAPQFEKFFESVGDSEPTEEQRAALFNGITAGLVRELAPQIARSTKERRKQRKGT